MRIPAQHSQISARFICVSRLPEHPSVEEDHGIGAKHEAV
jgi:hypothetical protein